MAGKRPSAGELEAYEEEVGKFQISEEEGKEYYSFADGVIDMYEKMGLSDAVRPSVEDIHTRIFPGTAAGQPYDGRMPILAVDLTLDQISAAYSLACNWHNYVASQHSVIAVKRSQAINTRDMMKSMIRMKHKALASKYGISQTDQRLSDLTRTDSRFVPYDADYEALNAVFTCLTTHLESAKRQMDALSREVSIRQTKAEAEARGRGMPSRFNPGAAGLPKEKRRSNNAEEDRTPGKVAFKTKRRPRKGS